MSIVGPHDLVFAKKGEQLMPTSAEEREQTSAQGVSTEGVANPDVSQAYAYYVLGLLFVVTIFNYIDRQILSILLQPIKDDLKISDTALGFLSGGT